MQEFLTKCPHCTTVFKFNQVHLDAAQGAVRCGSCLEVFNAKKHLLDQDISELLPQAANGHALSSAPAGNKTAPNIQNTSQLNPPKKKGSTLMKDPLAEEGDVHWTQALSNDIDKIYQYLATELDLESDLELAQNLKDDQWGRDLLAELDEELSSVTIPEDDDGVDGPFVAPKPKKRPQQALKNNAKSATPNDSDPSSVNAASRKPKSQGEPPAEKASVKPSPSRAKASDKAMGAPGTEPPSKNPAVVGKSQKKADPKPASTKAADISTADHADALSDTGSLTEMDDWSAALLDDLKNTVDQAESAMANSGKAKEKAKKDENQRPAASAIGNKLATAKKSAQQMPPPAKSKTDKKAQTSAKQPGKKGKSATSATPEKNTISPTFIDPAGLEADGSAAATDNKNLNENWSNSLLAELEHQSQNIAQNIKEVLHDKDQNSLMPEEEVSLDDLALIPLREYSADEDAPTPAKRSKTKSQQQKSPDGAPNKQAHAKTPKDKKSADAPTDIKSDEDDSQQQSDEISASLASLSPELEEHEMMAAPRKRLKISWSAIVCSIFFSITLAGQIAYFELDALAQDMRFRPWYEHACTFIKCELPPQEDFDAIRSAQFEVRAHPSENNALIVDANIINQAEFAQPFPAIELSFEDQNNTLVAKRRFTPDEYRGERLKQLDLMPPQRKIHLTFEIVDPGEAATSYYLKLIKHAPNRSQFKTK